jgi:uncharacterized RDD family membrane protein YckC
MNWYYADRGRQTGPVQQTELEELIRSGALPSSALVWTEGMGDWKPYSTVSNNQRTTAPASRESEPFEFTQNTGNCVCCGRSTAPHESAVIGKATVCFECKPVYLERMREGDIQRLPGALPYSGFWMRFTARVADYSVLNIFQSAFIAIFFSWMLRPKTQFNSDALVSYGVTALAGMVLSFGYQVYFLATRGATPGKMLCYMRVVRADGSPVSVGTAVGRFFGEIVDAFTVGIGYLMAAFDLEKRALHDRIAGTRVVDFPPVSPEDRKLQPVVREIRCASCKTEIPATDWNSFIPIPCPGCSTPVQAIVFPALSRSLASPVPEVKSGEGEAGCYYHDANRATNACEECGRFLCPVCDLDSGPRHLCPNCFNGHLDSGLTPEFVQRRTLYDSIALTAALIPNLLILTVYLTFFTAPIIVGFTIWSWRKPGSITPRTRWRFVVALLFSGFNLFFIIALLAVLIASVLRAARG